MCWESCRRGLTQADFGQELREAGVGAEWIRHRLDAEVNQVVDLFLVGEVEESEGLVFFPQPHVDGGGVDIRNESSAAKLLQLVERVASFPGIAGQSLRVAVGHKHCGHVAGE